VKALNIHSKQNIPFLSDNTIKPYCKRMIIYMRTKVVRATYIVMGTKCVKVVRFSWASKLGYLINPFWILIGNAIFCFFFSIFQSFEHLIV
jgi:hypothetical protein